MRLSLMHVMAAVPTPTAIIPSPIIPTLTSTTVIPLAIDLVWSKVFLQQHFFLKNSVDNCKCVELICPRSNYIAGVETHNASASRPQVSLNH
jgi:hypothetical protein